jgi:hypothetical protein
MKISAAWEQDDRRAPVAPARVAQYEGYCISHLLEKEFIFCAQFLNDLELLVWVEWK